MLPGCLGMPLVKEQAKAAEHIAAAAAGERRSTAEGSTPTADSGNVFAGGVTGPAAARSGAWTEALGFTAGGRRRRRMSCARPRCCDHLPSTLTSCTGLTRRRRATAASITMWACKSCRQPTQALSSARCRCLRARSCEPRRGGGRQSARGGTALRHDALYIHFLQNWVTINTTYKYVRDDT
jgi:hypothetical protein